MQLSIIIPTLNEASHIAACIERLLDGGHSGEILIVDGGSTDRTVVIADQYPVEVFQLKQASRAAQMNHGVAKATGDILYFVHADALPPITYASDIAAALSDGYPIGRFRFRFDSDKLLLRINSWFTRFDKPWVSGGDETLFIRKELFEKLGGYNEEWVIMEEYDLVKRAREKEPYKVIQKDVLVSARKYDNNSWMEVQRANLAAFRLFNSGAPSIDIRNTYYQMIHHPKDGSK